MAGWKCNDDSGWQDKFNIAFDCNEMFAWPIYIVSVLSSLQYSSIQLDARGVVDPDLLPPFGRVGMIGFSL